MPLHLQTEAASSFMTLPSGTDQFLFLNPANNKFSAINAASQVVPIGGVVATGTVAASGFAIFADGTGSSIESIGTIIPIAMGGTGSNTQNFVDLSNTQTVGGAKTFSTPPTLSGANITAGTVPNAALVTPPVTSVGSGTNITSSGGTAPTISFSGVLPVGSGGTGSSTQNFVDLSNTQTIGGAKTFSTAPILSGANVSTNTIPLASLVQLPANSFLGNIGAMGNVESLTGTQATSMLNNATTTVPGLLAATDKLFIQNYSNATIILVTANQYQNLACDGVTDDAANFNALLAAVPNNSHLVWPNCTMMINSAVTIPAGKHIFFEGRGFGKTIWQSNSFTSDFITCADWYQTFEGILFQANTTTTTAAGTVSTTSSTISISANTNIPSGAGTCYIATTANTYQLVSFTGSTSTSLTGCTTASGSFPYSNGAQITFKTGGYAINGSSMNYIVTQMCQFSYIYNGIYHGGTICQTRDSYFFGTVNFDMQFNGSIVNSIIHNVTCDGAPPAISHIEVNNAGSLLISNCDIIRGINNMRLNPTSPNGVFGVYAANTYFDTPTGGSSVKIMGTGNVQRVKFIGCWLSSSTTSSGLEVAGTGTTLPTAIDLTNCDIYGNAANGILMNGCQDLAVSNSRIAGNVTAGINVNPSTGSVTSLRANDNRIGPTGGIGANGNGVIINGGSYTSIELYQNNLIGNTSGAIQQGGVFGILNLSNNVGAPISGVAQTSTAILTTNINTTETVLTTANFGTGTQIGTAFRVTLFGTCTSTAANTSTFTLRFGTAGTTADASIGTATLTGVTSGTSIAFRVVLDCTVRVIGTAGQVAGYMSVQNGTSAATGVTGIVAAQTYVAAITASTTMNTTLNGILSVSYKSSATTTTCSFQGATIEVLGNAA